MGAGQKHKKWCNLKENDVFFYLPQKNLWFHNQKARFTTRFSNSRLRAQMQNFCQLWRRKKGYYILQQVFSQSVRRAEVVGAWIGWDMQKMFWLRIIHNERDLNNTRWDLNACLDATGVAFTKIQSFSDFSRKLAPVILIWLSNYCLLGALGMLVPFNVWGRLLC